MIDKKQVDRKENDADNNDYRRVLNVFRRRKRSTVQLFASMPDKFSDAFLLFSAIQRFYCFRHGFSPGRQAACPPTTSSLISSNRHLPATGLAGVPGLEPGPKVLETSMLTIDTIPLWVVESREWRVVSQKNDSPLSTLHSKLLVFFVQPVAAAAAAKLIKLKPVRRVLFVFCRHVVALFALSALQNYVISRHIFKLSAISHQRSAKSNRIH